MKPSAPIPAMLRARAIAAGILTFASHANAAILYWDGNDTTANADGGAGTWDTSAANWDSAAFGGSSATWNNGTPDSGVFGGTADTITLGENISVGGLHFDTSGYTINTGSNTLSFDATDNTIGFSRVSAATIAGAVGGTGNVSTALVNPLVGTALANFTLSFNGTSTGGWSGSTTFGNLSTIALSESNQALLNTSGIILNGGGITSTNVDGTEGALDRISNTAPITSNGGTIRMTNTAGSGIVYAESIGNLTHNGGQLSILHTTNQNGGSGNQQTLTLGDSGVGLSQSGTGNIIFSSGGGLNTTTNIIRVHGITTSMTGNQIIGPWATVGTGAGTATDFAKYTSDGTYGSIVAAAIVGSDETTWTDPANAYTLSNPGTTTLTGDRTMMGLRYSPTTGGTIALDTFKLQTYALMNNGAGGVTVSAGTDGTLTTPDGGGNLYLATNTNALNISAPITDNGGAVTVVKFGSNNLTLSGTNTFTGGVVLNGGALTAKADENLGAAGSSITVDGTSTLVLGSGTYARNFMINNGAIARFANANPTITGDVTGTGGIAMFTGFGAQPNFTGTDNTFEGPILIGSSGVTGQAYRFQFSSLADSATANGRIVFAASSVTHGDGSVFQYNGSSDLTLNNRVIEIASAGSTPTNGHQIRSSGTGTLSIDTDLLVTSTANPQTLRLGGTNTGANTFSGKIVDGTESAVVSLTKVNAGSWTLSGANTYTGATTVSGGTLRLADTSALANTSSITMNTASNNIIFGTDAAFTTLPNMVGSSGLTHSIVSDRATPGAGLNHAIGTMTMGAATFSFTSGGNVTSGTAGITVPSVTLTSGSAGTVILDPTTATLTITGGVTSQGNNVARTLQLDGTDTGSIGGTITQTVASPLSVSKTNTGIWTLSGANSYTGSTVIHSGTLTLIGATQATSAITFTGGSLGLDIANTVAAASAAVDFTNGNVTVTGTPAMASHTLLTANSISGVTGSTLSPTVPGYELQVIGGNELRLVSTGAPSGFAAWQAANGTTGDLGEDHDNDGVDNGVEHFLGGTGNTTGFTALPAVANDAGILSVTWTRHPDYPGFPDNYGTAVVVETSTTLTGPWTPETGGNVTITGNDIKYTFPGGPAYSARNFARLKVTGP